MDTHSRTTNAPLSSGVIEMRRLAAAHAAPGRTSVPTLELVLGVGSPVGGLGDPLAVRIPRPRRLERLATRALALLFAFAGGALVMGAGLRALDRPAAPREPAAPVAAPADVAPVVAEPAPRVVAPVPVEPVVEPVVETVVDAAAEPASRRRRPASTASAPSPAAEASASSAPRTAPSLDELLDRASGTASPASPTEPTPSLRRAPTRDEVRAAMGALAPRVAACAEGQRGLASVTVTVAGESGRARSALVSGDFAGTAVGSCIARELRTIELAPFAQETFTIQYPFAI